MSGGFKCGLIFYSKLMKKIIKIIVNRHPKPSPLRICFHDSIKIDQFSLKPQHHQKKGLQQ